jgi:hypothetical protein
MPPQDWRLPKWPLSWHSWALRSALAHHPFIGEESCEIGERCVSFVGTLLGVDRVGNVDTKLNCLYAKGAHGVRSTILISWKPDPTPTCHFRCDASGKCPPGADVNDSCCEIPLSTRNPLESQRFTGFPDLDPADTETTVMYLPK